MTGSLILASLQVTCWWSSHHSTAEELSSMRRVARGACGASYPKFAPFTPVSPLRKSRRKASQPGGLALLGPGFGPLAEGLISGLCAMYGQRRELPLAPVSVGGDLRIFLVSLGSAYGRSQQFNGVDESVSRTFALQGVQGGQSEQGLPTRCSWKRDSAYSIRRLSTRHH